MSIKIWMQLIFQNRVDYLIASEAVVEKEVGKGVVEVRTKANQAVSFVGVRQLPGEEIFIGWPNFQNMTFT